MQVKHGVDRFLDALVTTSHSHGRTIAGHRQDASLEIHPQFSVGPAVADRGHAVFLGCLQKVLQANLETVTETDADICPVETDTQAREERPAGRPVEQFVGHGLARYPINSGGKLMETI